MGQADSLVTIMFSFKDTRVLTSTLPAKFPGERWVKKTTNCN